MVSCQNVVETRRPDSTPGVVPRPWEQVLQAASGAMPRGDSASVAAAVAGFQAQGRHHRQSPRPNAPGVRAFERILTAMAARIRGRNEEAVAALTEAAALEEERSQVGPPIDPTARELLADLLLELGRFPEATAAYDTALQRTPLRLPCCSAELERRRSQGPGRRRALVRSAGAKLESRRPRPPGARRSQGRSEGRPGLTLIPGSPAGGGVPAPAHHTARASWPR